MKYIVFIIIILLSGCTQMKATHTHESLKSEWHYMKSTYVGYQDRDKTRSGNCVWFSVKCREDMIKKGIDPARMVIMECMIPAGRHAVMILDGEFVFDIGQSTVMSKSELDYIWIGEIDP